MNNALDTEHIARTIKFPQPRDPSDTDVQTQLDKRVKKIFVNGYKVISLQSYLQKNSFANAWN